MLLRIKIEFFYLSIAKLKTSSRIVLPLTKRIIMTRSSKTFIGILSFTPIIFTVVIIIMVFNMIPQFIEWDKQEPDFYLVFSTLMPFIITAIFACLISLGLLIFFLIHMLNNKLMEPVEKIIWILAFLVVGTVGYPLYWYMRIWNEKV